MRRDPECVSIVRDWKTTRSVGVQFADTQPDRNRKGNIFWLAIKKAVVEVCNKFRFCSTNE